MSNLKKLNTRLSLESLEERANPSAYLSNGDIIVVGNDSASSVVVERINIQNVQYYRVTENGSPTWFVAGSVTGGDVKFWGYGGDDYFRNATGLRTTASGHGGNDTLLGNAGVDYLYGGDGNDDLRGAGGNDHLLGGNGNDVLVGGAGRDQMWGEHGDDRMWGEAGNDDLVGGYGNDQLYGGGGYDRLWGEAGNDVLNGGDDGVADSLRGGSGADQFQQETYWNGFWWVNRDDPVDDNVFEGDSFYG
jgi:Ca2+-binding RTX toxin-like protein